jgi:multidrug efflux pump subunit AcrA (membrane-fusion protein)
MKRAALIVVILIVAGAAVGGGWWYVNQNPELWFRAQEELDAAVQELGIEGEEPPPGLEASGFVEADEASVTTELGGRIVALHADEGDQVAGGQTLVELDSSLLKAQIEVAEAELTVAEATLSRVKAPVRQETLDHAQAQVDQARAAQQAALVAWEDAQLMRDSPQEMDLAITAARAQVAVLESRSHQAEALANSAQAGRDLADEVARMIGSFEPFNIPVGESEYRVKLPADIRLKADQQQAISTYESWAAWASLDQANLARKGAASYLAELERQRANPLALQAAVNAAESQYEVATSAVALAQALVDGLEIGATPEQVSAVEAQVEVARAALGLLRVQGEKLTLQAPISGLVLERPVHVGELAVPGAPLMTLADLDNVTLTIFVPEDQIGKVQLGQPVSVTVDAYPEQTFPGAVTFIASQAEFTPKNVQTREERVNMVFAVKVRLPNEDQALKPGMPADAVILMDD